MGLYNYLGTNGEQVKCFYVPCIGVKRDPKTGVTSAYFHTSGGRLVGYTKEVPYKTRYYNYGKNFLILDYRWVFDEPFAHIIQNGEYLDTVNYQKVPQNIVIDAVIDNWGRWLNIHTTQEIIDFVNDYNLSDKLKDELEQKYYAEAGISTKIPSPAECKEMGQEKMMELFKLREELDKRVRDEAIRPFVHKWMLPDEPDIAIIGLLLDDYEYRKDRDDEFVKNYEYQWHIAFPDAIRQLKKLGHENPLEEYFEWAEQNDIEVDKNYVLSLFERYSQPCPKELEEEWFKSPFADL